MLTHLALLPIVLDAVAAEQVRQGRPCSAIEVWSAHLRDRWSSWQQAARALRQLSRLGVAEDGRRLVRHPGAASGARWSVVREAPPTDSRPRHIAALAAALRAPGDRDALDVVERVLLAELARKPEA